MRFRTENIFYPLLRKKKDTNSGHVSNGFFPTLNSWNWISERPANSTLDILYFTSPNVFLKVRFRIWDSTSVQFCHDSDNAIFCSSSLLSKKFFSVKPVIFFRNIIQDSSLCCWKIFKTFHQVDAVRKIQSHYRDVLMWLLQSRSYERDFHCY